MIEKIKTYKYGYKCIAMLLVFALSLNMLAGCGKSGSVNNTVQDEYKTENTAPEKDTEKESVDSQENTMPALELLGTELDTLEDQVKSGNVEETAMFNTYNMGVGMLTAVDKNDVDKTVEAIRTAGEVPYIMGEIVAGEKGITLL